MKKYVISLLVAVFWLSFSNVEATKTIKNPFAIHPPHRQKLVDSLNDLTTKDHDLLDGLADDDHTQYQKTLVTTRITSTATVTVTARVFNNYFCDTDGGAFTANLPAGTDEDSIRIMNTGTSANNLTVAPNGSELLIGVNSNFVLFDGESLLLVYESSEGWN